MSVLSLALPADLLAAVEAEAARSGITAAQWVADRLADRFGIRATTEASS